MSAQEAGSDEDHVYRKTSTNTTVQYYHTDPDCVRLKQARNKRRITRLVAQRMDLDACTTCTGGEE